MKTKMFCVVAVIVVGLTFITCPAMAGEGPYMGIVEIESVSDITGTLQADPPGRPCPVPPCVAEPGERLGLSTCLHHELLAQLIQQFEVEFERTQ